MLAFRRTISVLFSAAVALIASRLAIDVFFADGIDFVDYIRIALCAATAAWIAWGASLGVGGLIGGKMKTPPRASLSESGLSARTAILIPVYNEDPRETFSSALAMANSLAQTDHADLFDIVILSDSRNESVVAEEEEWFRKLHADMPRQVGAFYRRRTDNAGKKAGNIGDFVRRYGARYTYMLILDADSLMEGETIIEMLRRMEAEPKLGLLQSLPKIIESESWFARALQFSAGLFSPIYTRGLARMQGSEGPFWGHNALVRTEAFAESCGLPALSGRPPFGGHILSHDYVEAALLARKDWIVRVDYDLEGSFEEGPQNTVDFAKRDRRWCQGNLQHIRLLFAPGIKAWNRFTFLQGVMAYVSSPLWMMFIVASVVAPLFAPEPDYFPSPYLPAMFPKAETALAVTLLVGVGGLLIGPKLLIALRSGLTGEARRFGGFVQVFWSTLMEVVWSSILAPITLMYQSRSVMQVVLGMDGGWPASNREGHYLSLEDAFRASWWISLTGILMLAGAHFFAPDLFYWLMPIAVPQIISPFLISVTSSRTSGRVASALGLFQTVEEFSRAAIMIEKDQVLARWRPETVSADISEAEGGIESATDNQPDLSGVKG
ncbi:glucans biosynthesis glucosyltransferase MdoH [Martelella mediterranea]|uniref:Glucans biosynthesis glucosyltransferase H n=1 Tax=Martelella mediterranea TaxID=293089 RepID=A0A4R3NKC6_9HYPH|nr:glucans biosynthesis glucosyltransferase MdoH [Martelella mediterranea]TCT35278.1 membrane glycosyltransferase [Martelella mediterranea]